MGLQLLFLVVASCALAGKRQRAAATPEKSAVCAVVDVSNTGATLHDAQRQARAAGASAPCVRVLLGQRVFRLAEPLVLSAADSHTTFVGGEITTAISVPVDAWHDQQRHQLQPEAGGTAVSEAVARGSLSGNNVWELDVTQLVNASQWGKVSGSPGILPVAHLSLLVETAGVWRPMTVARWPNVPFDSGDTPPVNWTTVSATCVCPGSFGGGCGAGQASPSACGVGCDSFQWVYSIPISF